MQRRRSLEKLFEIHEQSIASQFGELIDSYAQSIAFHKEFIAKLDQTVDAQSVASHEEFIAKLDQTAASLQEFSEEHQQMAADLQQRRSLSKFEAKERIIRRNRIKAYYNEKLLDDVVEMDIKSLMEKRGWEFDDIENAPEELKKKIETRKEQLEEQERTNLEKYKKKAEDLHEDVKSRAVYYGSFLALSLTTMGCPPLSATFGVVGGVIWMTALCQTGEITHYKNKAGLSLKEQFELKMLEDIKNRCQAKGDDNTGCQVQCRTDFAEMNKFLSDFEEINKSRSEKVQSVSSKTNTDTDNIQRSKIEGSIPFKIDYHVEDDPKCTEKDKKLDKKEQM